MKLIIGLGNPDKIYQNTRHNLGFLILKKIAENRKVNFFLKQSFESEIADFSIDDGKDKIKLVRPQTYMNNSGKAVLKIKNFYKIPTENIWVIYDDVDLNFKKVRISFGGSSAGHKGVQSIIDQLGVQFWRIRIGVGKNITIPTDKWVLQNFTKEESKTIPQVIDKVSSLVVNSLGKDLTQKTINIED